MRDSSIRFSHGSNVGRVDRQVAEHMLEITRISALWNKVLWRKFNPKGIAGEDNKTLFLMRDSDQ